MRRGGAVACAFVVLGVMVAGCTETSAGDPTPQGSETEAPGSSEVQRPHDVSLEGLEPCSLIPESDWSRFYIEKQGKSTQSETFDNAPMCLYLGGGQIRPSLTLVTTEGVDVWLDGRRADEVEPVDPVLGFPTLYAKNELDPGGCDLIVDVADGQYLLIGATWLDPDDDNSAEACEYAHQVAESVMSTVVGS